MSGRGGSGGGRGGPKRSGGKPAGGGGPKGRGAQRGSAKTRAPGQRRGTGQRGTTPMRAKDENKPGPKGKNHSGVGGHQIEGRQAVRELLLAGTRRTREVILSADLDPAPILEEIVQLADEMRVPISEMSRTKFDATTKTEGPQGVLAYAESLPTTPLEELLQERNGVKPFLLVLDGVTDPGNLGAVLRTAECAGVTGIVLPKHRSAHITPTVTKTAAGAVEHLPMAVVGGLPTAIKEMSAAGVWTVGLDMAGGQTIFELEMAGEGVALVLGAEGKGLSKLVRERCDVTAMIPMKGALNSLNVSAAGAVAIYEIARGR